MTDWETTKIKKPVKEKAAEDPRTYTEIMQAGLDTSGNTHTQGNEVTTNGFTVPKESYHAIADRLEAIESELADLSVSLDASERAQIARDVEEKLR